MCDYFVRVFYVEKGAIVLCMHVKFYTDRHDVFVCTGFLDDEHMQSPDFYPDLSELWLADPLHTKSQVCSICGGGTRSAYFCADPSCFHSLCYQCYSTARWPSVSFMNWPSFDDFHLPPSRPLHRPSQHSSPSQRARQLLRAVSPHHGQRPRASRGQQAGADRQAVVRARPLSASRCRGLHLHLRDQDTTPRTPATTARSRRSRRPVGTVHAERLIINLTAHMDKSKGFMLGNETYSGTQVIDLLRPLILGFRGSFGRSRAPVMVYLNVCDADATMWDNLVQAEAAATSFEAIAFASPHPPDAPSRTCSVPSLAPGPTDSSSTAPTTTPPLLSLV